ncbi:MAG: hypothetical protein ACLRPW_05040 [Intestinibacter sp.]
MKKINKLLNNIDEDKYLDNEKSLSENEKEKILNMTMDKIKNSSNQSKNKGKVVSLKDHSYNFSFCAYDFYIIICIRLLFIRCTTC